MFIEVNKVVEDKEITEDGSTIRNPIDSGTLKGFKIQQEFIRIEEIRSFRHWTKNKKQDMLIEGPMTKLYLYSSDKEKKKSPEMLINESKDSFAKRLNATMLEDGEKEN